MRNSCNPELARADLRLRDFDVVWLDDHLERLMLPFNSKSGAAAAAATDATATTATVTTATATAAGANHHGSEAVQDNAGQTADNGGSAAGAVQKRGVLQARTHAPALFTPP